MSNCAPSGGANSAKTVLPPPSTEYRNNYDEIFRKKEKKAERRPKLTLQVRRQATNDV